MRVLITASREWTDKEAIWTALNAEYLTWNRKTIPNIGEWSGDTSCTEFVVVHGGARGGDMIADDWANRLHKHDPRVRPEAHPVSSEEWQMKGKSAGHQRNATMVKKGADVCLAFPLGESPGTRGCMKLAEKAKIPVVNGAET